MPNSDQSIQTLPVYQADMFTVIDGVNLGDALSFAAELEFDDIYGLSDTAEREFLKLRAGETNKKFYVAHGSALGTLDTLVYLDSSLTLMSPDGSTFEVLVMVEVDNDEVQDIYVLPLASIAPKTSYRLVGVDTDNAGTRLAQVACVAFTRGTHITLSSGAQKPIEELSVGEKVLTRDDGPQPLRWIGQNTVRAIGQFAPVLIEKGTLHNENDLIVSPDHRLFIYQRQDALGAGRSEVLVKARHLINDTTVRQQDGGHVDYFQLLFDDHQIIYAEGIAAESLLVDTRTRAALPDDLSRHRERNHFGYEIDEDHLTGPDTVEKLRKASSS